DSLDGLHLRAKRRRAHGSTQEAKPRPQVGFVILHAAAGSAQEFSPGTRLSFICQYNGAIRVIQVQDGGLSKQVSGAPSLGGDGTLAAVVVGITFYLGGTELVSFHQQR